MTLYINDSRSESGKSASADFITIVSEGQTTREIPRVVKACQVSTKHAIAELEYERSYWESRGVDWKIVGA